MIAEINMLKKSLPNAEKLLAIKPKIDKLYDEKKVVVKDFVIHKTKIGEKEAEIEAVRKELETAREERDGMKEQLDKFEEEI